MKIKIWDIPPGGREVDFALDLPRLNERLAIQNPTKGSAVEAPSYRFTQPPDAHLKLEVEGSTVLMNGHVDGVLRTICARCMDEVEVPIHSNLQMVLKPISERDVNRGADEDVGFDFYDGKEIDCGFHTEESLVLAIPYTVYCQEDCKGLCPSCGQNLNTASCDCASKEQGAQDPRFDVLRSLKLH